MVTDVIVVNYRSPGDLERFLHSFDAYGTGNLWVVNVSPGPEDDEVAQKFVARPESHVRFESNIGYARACNAAAALGTGDVIALFNADTELSPDLVSTCSEMLMLNESWGVAGPRQVDSRGRITHAGIFGPDDAPQHRGWHQHGGYEDIRDDCYSVSGAAYFVKRSVWDELTDCPIYRDAVEMWAGEQPEGAFLPTDLWYEETWCSVHARAHGHQVAYIGTKTMRHELHGAGSVKRGKQLMNQAKSFFVAACQAHMIVFN